MDLFRLADCSIHQIGCSFQMNTVCGVNGGMEVAMIKKAKTVFLSMAIAAMSISGCQNKSTSDGGTKIYYAAIESGDYYEGWASQLGEQAGKLGASFEVGYAENSIETQVAQIKEAADNSNVILCGPVSADVVSELEAAAKDTPIVFINNAPNDEHLEKGRYIYVASDEYMAGQYQAEYILEKFANKEEINVVLLKGPKEASGTTGRTEGLKQTLKSSGKNINYVFEDNANWNEDIAKELTGMFLKTGRQADCVVANNDDMAIGAAAAFEEAGINTDSVLFLGVDASAGGCEAIAAGKMDFTVYQPMSAQINAAVTAAKNLAEGKGIGGIEGAAKDGRYILLPFEKVDANNVSSYQ